MCMQKTTIISLILFLVITGTITGLYLTQALAPSPIVEERCHPTNAPYKQAELEVRQRVDDLLSRMTRQEKIGQIALVEKNGLATPNDIRDYHLGALLSGAGSRPATNTPDAWLQMIEEYQAKAKETCLEIPLLYGIDAVHGVGGVEGATVFPHAIGLAASRDSDLVRRVAAATTKELSALGIYWNFAPNLDVAQDQRWGRVYETFGSDTQTVSDLGRAYLQGVQTTQNNQPPALATLKHFVGNGEMTWGTSGNADYRIDQGDTQLSEAELRERHLPPFKQAIEEGALVVMAGLNEWNGTKVSANRYLITEVLKQELGFQGLVVSDWYGVYALSKDRYTATVTGINAGIDLVMLPFDYKLFAADMERALARGDISEERLNDAVRRILTVKFKAGLFDRPAPTKEDLSIVGASAHHELAREAVQKSLTLLQNKQNTLPLTATSKRILVAGSAADNLGYQSGGWTIEWQGINGNDFPGTTLLAGIRATVSPTSQVVYDKRGTFTTERDRADVGIAIVGETPYAEGVGDKANPGLSAEDLQAIKQLQAKSKRVVVVIVSGRALALPPEAASWDAIVAAWLPGSEGQGVADGLFGHSPITGRLPVPWKID